MKGDRKDTKYADCLDWETTEFKEDVAVKTLSTSQMFSGT